MILEWQMYIIAFATICLYFTNDRSAFLFAFLVIVSFFISYFLSPVIKSLDSQYFYRYLFWIINDVAWMGVVSFLALRDKIKMYQCIWGQLFMLPVIAVQMFRIADRYVLELPIYNYIYKVVIPIANTLLVLLVLMPLLSRLLISKRPVKLPN